LSNDHRSNTVIVEFETKASGKNQFPYWYQSKTNTIIIDKENNEFLVMLVFPAAAAKYKAWKDMKDMQPPTASKDPNYAKML